MATNDITITARLKCNDLNIDKGGSASFTVTVAAGGYNGETITLTTTPEHLPIIGGAVATNGWCFIQNKSTTQNVDVGYLQSAEYNGTWQELFTLYPGEYFVAPLNHSSGIAAAAHAGTAQIDWLVTSR